MGDEVVETRFGKFLIDPEDLIGSTLKAHTVWDGPGFLQLLARDHAFGKDQTVIDVGANQGVWTIWLAGHGIRVVAVEPVSAVVQRLKANLDLNQAICADRVIVVPKAAYDQDGWLGVPAVDPGNLGGTALTRSVKAGAPVIETVVLDTLAPLWHPHGVSLIKIDTQGCDGRVILGLQETLRRWRPTVVFEWERDLAAAHGVTLMEIWRLLETLGYQVVEWPSHPGNYVAVAQEGSRWVAC